MTMQFLPWVRRGLAAELDARDSGQALPIRATFPVTVTVNGVDARTDIATYGPGDVTGLDVGVISRTAPGRFATNVAPDEFAAIEFDVADLPWMFTPASAGSNQRLRPWLVLVVVERRAGVRIGHDAMRPLPTLQVEAPAVPADELPDLAESWAWAHTQILSASPSTDAVDELTNHAERTLSRIVCPRRLRPDTQYFAALVPAFDAGVGAGMGTDPDPSATTVGPAWDVGSLGDAITLPVFYHWEFTTGPAGDFESLARKLRPMAVPDGVGESPMYIGAAHPALPALDADAGGILQMEGALRAPESGSGTPLDGRHTAYVDALVDLVDAGVAAAGVGSARDAEAVAPPIYGQWHADRHQIPARNARPRWLRTLNADPRHRVAAGLGAEVVRANQEEYVDVAWRQVGDVLAANRLLELSRAMLAVAERIHTRHIATVPDVGLLALAERATSRLLLDGVTLDRRLTTSASLDGAVTRSFRRLASPVSAPMRAAARFADALEPIGRVSVDGVIGAITGEQRPVLSGAPDGIATCSVPRLTRDGPLIDDALPTVGELSRQVVGLERDLTSQPPLRPRADLGRTGVLTEVHLDAARTIAGSSPSLASVIGDIRDLATRRPGTDVLGGVAIDGRLVPVVRRGDGRVTVRVRGRDIGLPSVVAAGTAPRATRSGGVERESGRSVGRVPGGPAGDRDMRGLPGRGADTRRFDRTGRVPLDARFEPATGTGPVVTPLAVGTVTGVGEVGELLRGSGIARDAVVAALPRGAEGEIGVTTPAPLVDATVTTLLVDGITGFAAPLATIGVALAAVPEPVPFDVVAERTAILTAMQPRPVVEARLGARINVAGGLVEGVLPERLTIFQPEPVAPIMVGPVLDRPLYFDLARYDQNRFLPGAGAIPENAITLVETNPAFVEAFMVGANHEFNRELLWRRYPTDRRGTAFRKFWDRVDGGDDIEPIHTWSTAANLGSVSEGDADGSVVLLVRGQLLRRYPNTIVYAAAATADRRIDPAAPAMLPVFAGFLQPDIVFVGFDFDVDAATAGTGTMFVLQEQPTEPRFGLDVPVGAVPTAPPAAWSDLTWGHVGVEPGGFLSMDAFAGNPSRPLAADVPAVVARFGSHAGDLAAITFQRPFRAAVHSSEVLA